MSLLKRSQQWAAFARIWHIYDAKWQDPFQSAPLITRYLNGKHKPIYHPMNYCGDIVVVINCKDIALRGDEWTKRVYFHHNTYHSGDTWTLAWELHKKNKTMIMQKAVYSAMKGNLQRRHAMARLLLYEDEKVPKDIMENISSQIKQLRPVPVRLDHIPQEEVEEFPRLMKYPKDYILR